MLLFALLPGTLPVFAQKQAKNISFFLFDKEWKGCNKPADAQYLAYRKKINDSTYEWRYYNYSGPLINIETTKDEAGARPHGYLAYYGKDGKIDSSGSSLDGRKNGWWYYYTDSLTVWLKEKYENGRLLERMDTLAMRLEREKENAQFDSTDVLIEASFKNGDKDWMKYIQKNLKVPDRTEKIGRGGTVIVQFVVDKDGNVRDVDIVRSVEYAIDEAAISLIEKSPVWKPASVNGRPVKAYRRQPLTVQF